MSSDRKSDAGKIVVTPTARRGCADDNGANNTQSADSIPTVFSVIDTLKDSEDLKKLSNQVLVYADKAEKELTELQLAINAKDRDKVEKHSAALTGLCADVGATQMMRLCYQIQIIARQGSLGGADGLHQDLRKEFERVKSTLRLA